MNQLTPQPNVGRLGDLRKFSWKFWVMTVLTGIGSGIAGGLLMKLLFTMQSISWPNVPGDYQDHVAAASIWRHVIVMFAAGLFAGVARYALKFTPGGHGGELSKTIWFSEGKFPALVTFSKAVLSIVIVGMGAAIGREGALKQSGAAIASKLCDWMKLPPEQRRLLAACGGGAGMAAAYNVPLGGALFGLEVLLGTVSLPLVVPALMTSMIATAVSWTLLPKTPIYHAPVYSFSIEQIPWTIAVGPILGIASVYYIRLMGWASKVQHKGAWIVLSPAIIFTLLGLLAVPYPELLGNGKDVVQRSLTDVYPLGLMAILMVLRPAATASCFASGAPGGLFTPTMTTGALMGGMFGHLYRMISGGSVGGTYALLGSAAFLAATTQGPISSIVLVIELTWHVEGVIVPLLIAVTIATAVSRRFEKRSIYSARIEDEEAVSMEAHHGKKATDYMVLPASATYGRVMRRMVDSVHRKVPLFVVDANGKLKGEITVEAVERVETSAVPLDTTAASDLVSGVETPRPPCS